MQEDEKDKLINVFTDFSNLPKMKEEEIRRDYQFISNTICSFVDFMKIRAPSIDLEPSVIKVILFNINLKVLFQNILRISGEFLLEHL